jgi:hypothetical protein
MAVRRGHSDHVSADRTTGPRPILDHEGLPDLLADLLEAKLTPQQSELNARRSRVAGKMVGHACALDPLRPPECLHDR